MKGPNARVIQNLNNNNNKKKIKDKKKSEINPQFDTQKKNDQEDIKK